MEWEGWDGDAFEECNIECRRSSDTRENSSLAKNRSDRKLLANGISKDRDFLFVKKNRSPLRKRKTRLSFRFESRETRDFYRNRWENYSRGELALVAREERDEAL